MNVARSARRGRENSRYHPDGNNRNLWSIERRMNNHSSMSTILRCNLTSLNFDWREELCRQWLESDQGSTWSLGICPTVLPAAKRDEWILRLRRTSLHLELRSFNIETSEPPLNGHQICPIDWFVVFLGRFEILHSIVLKIRIVVIEWCPRRLAKVMRFEQPRMLKTIQWRWKWSCQPNGKTYCPNPH